MFDHDLATEAAAYSVPGADPRQWVSYGLVKASSPGSRSVLFLDEKGAPRPYPVVLVTLQPSGVDVACRVFGHSAGAGEGEWSPFVDGDEVLVVIPGGDERSGCVILGRGNSSRDNPPAMVAGNDPTENNFAYKRVASPYVVESGNSLLFRTTPTGAFLSISQTGNVVAQSGDGHYLSLQHDMLTVSTQDLSTLMQVDPSKQQVFLQAAGTQLLLDSAGKSLLLTAGTFSVGAGGATPTFHVATVEGYLQFVQGLLTALATAFSPLPGPLAGADVAAVFTATAAALAGVVSLAAASPLLPATTAAVGPALLPGSSPANPNIGCSGFLAG